MPTTIQTPARGRPRSFDLDAALATGQALFHEHGYGAVGLAAITTALGIKPPSFYAAFGSKAAFLEKILDRYAAASLPLDRIFHEGRAPSEAIADLLESAAHIYSASPRARGCLALETARACGDPEAAAIARRAAYAGHTRLSAFVSLSHPLMADAVSDYVRAIMSGMSSGAREGWSTERLLTVARAGSAGVLSLLAEEEP